MASINKITEMIAAVKTIYSYYAKDTDVKVLVKVWEALLKPYEDELVEAAFYNALQACKMPPTPADVIEQIKCIHKALEPSDEELWAVYNDALRRANDYMSRFGYTYIDESGISQGKQARMALDKLWEGLPEKIKSYLGTKGELMRNAQAWGNDKDFGVWEKPRFMKTMPVMEKRQEYSGMMLEGGQNKLLLQGGE